MAKAFWLASYPKSGNTWLRLLLINCLRDANSPADINDRALGPIASSRSCFDEWAGVEASALDDDLIEELRPLALRCMLRESEEPVYMKVHDAWRRTRKGDGLIPADVTGGVVYMVRNPLDLASSCAHHWGVDVTKAVANLCDSEFTLARSCDKLSEQLRQRLDSWSSHVCRWLDDSGLPLHLVRYEDLHEDPEKVFGGVVRFLGLPWDAARVRKAVLFSNFTELQRQERQSGFRERPSKSHGAFFRRGVVGGWRHELPASMADKIIHSHGAVMQRFKYLEER